MSRIIKIVLSTWELMGHLNSTKGCYIKYKSMYVLKHALYAFRYGFLLNFWLISIILYMNYHYG